MNKVHFLENGSATLSINDTASFMLGDKKLPSDSFQCNEKIQAFSLLLDVYLGINHRYSVALRTHLVDLCPLLTSGLHHTHAYYPGKLLLTAM